MAINIFSGGSPGKQKKVNSASASTRAKQAKQALTAPSETSTSGSTAVKTQGTLSKVGNFVGKAAGIAAKFLPGVGGTIANGIASLFNDPEWWQSIPGDAVTLNSPLRMVDTGGAEQAGPRILPRAAILEVSSSALPGPGQTPFVIEPTEQAITQYLMPHIRKVVNAIPLQSASDYKQVLQTNATLYAAWRTLKKFDYLLKHGQTYIANLNDAAFPMLQVDNADKLQSLINRLEEYLRANVRLPHTLCEYLAWRFGRIYKSNNSAKAALVLYDAIMIGQTYNGWLNILTELMRIPSSTPALQQANADLYNTYYEHDLMVEIRDDTQFKYDLKEFMLRINMDIQTGATNPSTANPVCIDSTLDNPTTFMASTVSTTGTDDAGNLSCLFPVKSVRIYIPIGYGVSSSVTYRFPIGTGSAVTTGTTTLTYVTGSNWTCYSHASVRLQSFTENNVAQFITAVMFTKSVDLYNCQIYVNGGVESDPYQYDVSALSIDMGLVEDRILGVEHVYAFANLVDSERKHSLSYAKAEKLVARDTANLIDAMDVASVK